MENINFFHRFRSKLILMILIFTILPAIFLYLIYANFIKEIISKKYTDAAVQSVYSAGENINYVLNDMVEFSNLILTNRDFIRDLNHTDQLDLVSFKSLIRSFFTSREDVDGIYVYTKEEAVYYIGTVKANEAISVLLKAKLEDTSGEAVWIKTKPEKIKIFSGQFIKYYFSLGRKLIDFNTLKELGYLQIDIDESILEKSYNHLLAENDSEVFIIAGDGEVISHTDKSMIGKNIGQLPSVKEILSATRDHGYTSFQKDNEDIVWIYSVCNENGWRLVKTVPTDYLYEELNDIQKRMIAVGVICFWIDITLLLIFSIKTTKPMIDMMRLMKKAEKGDLNVRIQHPGKDEIGQLGESFNHMLEKMEALIIKQVEEERGKKEIELEVLRAQINPHFLYNTLNTIKLMAKIQGDKSIANAITALIKLLRISINLGKDMIPLSEEIEYVKNYILIQKLRFNERFTISYDIAEDCLGCLLPKLILQPIVENSIIYGADNAGKSSLEITIKAFQKGNILTISVTDNGPGIDSETLNKIFKVDKDINRFSTVGLNNVNQRIGLYFGKDYGVTIDTQINSGTKVAVNIPVKLN